MKYIAVAKILFKAQLAYRFDVIMTALGMIWRVVFAWILWGAIFAGTGEISGFTFQAMLSYYVISSFLATMDMSEGTVREISGRIREGTFSKFMVIPSNPQLHFLSQTLGASAYYGIFAALAAAVSVLIFNIDLTIAIDPVVIPVAVALFLLGVLFMNSYQFFFGLWAFKFQDMTFAIHLLPNIISFFKGELVPLSLLPDAFVKLLRFSPFTHMVYTPAMLLIGRLDIYDGLFGVVVLAAWVFAMMAVSQFTYGKLRRKYEGVGI